MCVKDCGPSYKPLQIVSGTRHFRVSGDFASFRASKIADFNELFRTFETNRNRSGSEISVKTSLKSRVFFCTQTRAETGHNN